jgi:hypothetical protein
MTSFALFLIAVLYIWGYAGLLFDVSCHCESWAEFWVGARSGWPLVAGAVVSGVWSWWIWD